MVRGTRALAAGLIGLAVLAGCRRDAPKADPHVPATGKAAMTRPVFETGAAFRGVEATHVVYLVDNGGSMLPVWGEAVDQLHKAIRGLEAARSFHVVFFGKDTVHEAPAGRLLPATDANKAAVEAFVNETRAAGYSCAPVKGLAAAFRAFKGVPDSPGVRKVCFLMTDGDFDETIIEGPRRNDYGSLAVLAWLRENNADKAVHVYPIILGEKPSKQGEESMRMIASENGGEFRFIERKD